MSIPHSICTKIQETSDIQRDKGRHREKIKTIVHANLKYRYRNRHFWARGYYVDTVERNKRQIQEYIRNQLQEDELADPK